MFKTYKIKSIDEIDSVPVNQIASIIGTNIYGMRAKNHPSPDIPDGLVYLMINNDYDSHICAHAAFDKVKNDDGSVTTTLKFIHLDSNCESGPDYVAELLSYMIEHDNLVEFDLSDGIPIEV